MEQRPRANSVMVDPLVPVVVQTDGVVEVKVTGLVDPPPVADTVKGAEP